MRIFLVWELLHAAFFYFWESFLYFFIVLGRPEWFSIEVRNKLLHFHGSLMFVRAHAWPAGSKPTEVAIRTHCTFFLLGSLSVCDDTYPMGVGDRR